MIQIYVLKIRKFILNVLFYIIESNGLSVKSQSPLFNEYHVKDEVV